MQFREVVGGRKVARPSLDEDDLESLTCAVRDEIELDWARVRGGSGSGGRAGGSIAHSVVVDVDLTAAVLSPLTVSDVRLHGVDLSNAVVEAVTVRRTELFRGRAIGLRLAVEQVEDVYVEGVRLDYAQLDVARAKGSVVFRECSFRETRLAGDLSAMVFDQCDLSGALFEARTAKDADFRTSEIGGVHGLLSLRGARITPEQTLLIAAGLAAEAGLVVDE